MIKKKIQKTNTTLQLGLQRPWQVATLEIGTQRINSIEQLDLELYNS